MRNLQEMFGTSLMAILQVLVRLREIERTNK